MNVLLTGGAGFIGSHLGQALLAGGHTVTVLDDLSTGAFANVELLRAAGPVKFFHGSVCDRRLLAEAMEPCELVFHLAAAVGVKLIADDPVNTIRTNITGTELVLEMANRTRRKVVLASSSEVYGKNTRTPFREDDDTTLGPTHFSRWSYACSKMADEFLAMAYHQQFGLPIVICRFFNTIGPRQSGEYGMVVPRFVRWALAGEPIQIYGTGRQSRCFCHVADVVEALIALAGCQAAQGQVVNIGADEVVTVEALADKILEITGSTAGKRHISYEEAYGRPIEDLQVRAPDIGKIRRLIGFAPRHNLDQTLREIVDHERRRKEH